MLWAMLNMTCFFVCMLGALGAARDAKTSFVGYGLAVLIGLAVGGSSTWAMWSIGKRVVAAVQAHPEARRELYWRILYVAAVPWILLALLIAKHVTSAGLRLVASGI
jgi:hypothetical protein